VFNSEHHRREAKAGYLVNKFTSNINRIRIQAKNMINPKTSVWDPWHFGTDRDADPRIRTSDFRIQMRIRMLIRMRIIRAEVHQD